MVADLGGIQTILDAVHLGLGSSVAMAANAQSGRRSDGMLLLPIRHPEIIRCSGLFQLKYSPLTPAGESVKALTIEVIAQLLGQGGWAGAKLA